jgi:hypothetical protein
LYLGAKIPLARFISSTSAGQTPEGASNMSAGRMFFLIACLWLGVTSAAADNNSRSAFSVWPDTGQNNCYDATVMNKCPAEGQAFFGQDAQYDGPARSYTLLAEGTMVQDNVTGLIWELKNEEDGTPNYHNLNDGDNLYSWCNPSGPDDDGYQGVCDRPSIKTFIDGLNAAQFGGYSDWRVPTLQELVSLVNRGVNTPSPALDPVFVSASQAHYSYWSATSQAGAPQKSWQVSLGLGSVHSIHHIFHTTVQTAAVRAVRGGVLPPKHHRYIDNGDGTVTDNVTCLQWQQASMDADDDGYPDAPDWEGALSAAEQLTLGGYADWRLPNINELLSLLDYSRSSPNLDPVFAGVTRTGYHHSSTPHIYSDSSWMIEFTHGMVYFFKKIGL